MATVRTPSLMIRDIALPERGDREGRAATRERRRLTSVDVCALQTPNEQRNDATNQKDPPDGQRREDVHRNRKHPHQYGNQNDDRYHYDPRRPMLFLCTQKFPFNGTRRVAPDSFQPSAFSFQHPPRMFDHSRELIAERTSVKRPSIA